MANLVYIEDETNELSSLLNEFSWSFIYLIILDGWERAILLYSFKTNPQKNELLYLESGDTCKIDIYSWYRFAVDQIQWSLANAMFVCLSKWKRMNKKKESTRPLENRFLTNFIISLVDFLLYVTFISNWINYHSRGCTTWAWIASHTITSFH